MRDDERVFRVVGLVEIPVQGFQKSTDSVIHIRARFAVHYPIIKSTEMIPFPDDLFIHIRAAQMTPILLAEARIFIHLHYIGFNTFPDALIGLTGAIVRR